MTLEGILRREEQQIYLQKLSAEKQRLQALNEIAQTIKMRLDIWSIIQKALAGLESLFSELPMLVLTRQD
ncbi:MAG: hypothetical protein V2G42_05605 [bacterium JZ-2024 1]